MTVAIVGGGIFGTTIAIHLARAGVKVDIFETYSNILKAASGINQYRLHRGYHYPRSPQTAIECLQGEFEFRKEYSEAIIDLESEKHFYAIAKDGSLVGADQYIEFCQSLNLEFTIEDCPLVRKSTVCLCIAVSEARVDVPLLREIILRKIHRLNARLYLQTEATPKKLEGYDYIILTAYARQNELSYQLTGQRREFQFELCEKPVVELPHNFFGTSVVIIDGPFMCVDPLWSSSSAVLGNVTWAIHQQEIGYAMNIREDLKPFVNTGVVRKPPISRFSRFIESGAVFIPKLAHAKYKGSMFTIRTVIPGKEMTDERPTIIEWLDERVISVFSGKIGTCVSAAHKVLGMINNSKKRYQIA